MSLIIDLRNINKINTDLNHVWGIFDYLIEKYNYKMENISSIDKESKKNLSNYFKKKYNETLKNIVIFSHLKYLQLDFEVPKDVNFVWYGDDLHSEDKYLILPKINKFILSYAYAMNLYFPNINKDKYFFPHSYYFDIEFNNNPIKKLLVSGRHNNRYYPKRKFAIILYKNKHPQVSYIAPNFGYTIVKNDRRINNYIFGKKYIEELNKYLICFTCDSCKETPYILAKVFEIMSSGALLLYAIDDKNKKYFEKLGFVDGVHYISCSRNRIKTYIEKYLQPENIEYVNQVRRNGYDFVRKYHSYKNRAELIHQIVNGSANMEEHLDGINGTKYYVEKRV